MMIPGANLLGLAMGIIQPLPVTLEVYTGRSENAAGYQDATFAAPVGIQASVQPIPRGLYEALGLDFSKDYVMLYTGTKINVPDRDASSDRITWNGASYTAESLTDWKAQDGWVGVVCVRVSMP